MIGELKIINDAEIPAIIYEIFKEMELPNFTIYINNRKILNGLFEYINEKNKSSDIMRIIDKYEKIGKENIIKELEEYKISKESIKYIINFIEIKGNPDKKIEALSNLKIENELFKKGLEELKETVKYIRLFNIPEENFNIDLKIARGLDYYTGTVYETFLNEHKSIGSICSGGRYDNLAEYYTDKKLPGVGISIGLTRLFYILNEMNLIKINQKSISKVLIISMIEDLSFSIKTANSLRKEGINTEIYFDDKKIKSKFKYGNKLNIPYIIIIGEDEIKSGKLTLKDMSKGEQFQKNIEEIIMIIK